MLVISSLSGRRREGGKCICWNQKGQPKENSDFHKGRVHTFLGRSRKGRAENEFDFGKPFWFFTGGGFGVVSEADSDGPGAGFGRFWPHTVSH